MQKKLGDSEGVGTGELLFLSSLRLCVFARVSPGLPHAGFVSQGLAEELLAQRRKGAKEDKDKKTRHHK